MACSSFSRFALLTLVGMFSLGCQRLPDEDGPITGGGGGTMSGTSNGTFLPQDETGDDESGLDDGQGMSCDPVEQAGCGAGERCTVVTSVAGEPVYGCVADNGTLEPFDPCTAEGGGVDGCQAGLACVTDVSTDGTCLGLCNDNGDCDLGVCNPSTFGDIPYCADDCSPFEPLCPPPTSCRRNNERFSCRVPQEFDVGAAGAPCEILDDGGCTAGFICVPGALVPDCMDQNCCVPLCELDEVGGCSSPATCNSALLAPAPGFENIGACFVPA